MGPAYMGMNACTGKRNTECHDAGKATVQRSMSIDVAGFFAQNLSDV